MRTVSIVSFFVYLFLRSSDASSIGALSADSWSRANTHHTAHHTQADPSSTGVREFALALRWTGELNRRLMSQQQQEQQQQQDSSSSGWLVTPPASSPRSSRLLVRGGDRSPPQQSQEPLSMFHAQHARPHRTGAARWGPDLETSLLPRVLGLVKSTSVDTSQLLTLASLYMDRATCVATPRSGDPQAAALPYCTPRTVHRLTLAAVVLAHERVNNNDSEEVVERLSLAFGLSELPQLVAEMRRALGDVGTFVTPTQLAEAQQQQRERGAKLQRLLA